MMDYYVCSSCHCYVRARDVACPFCAASRASEAPVTPRVQPSSLSRAQRIAVGAAFALLGCEGPDAQDRFVAAPVLSENDPAPDASAEAGSAALPVDDAAVGHAADGLVESATDASVAATDASAETPFACGSASCDPQTQFCLQRTYDICGGMNFLTSCEDLPPPGGDPCAGYGGCVVDAGAGGGRTVAVLVSGTCPCTSCNPCYGAPPPRLERQAIHVS